MTALGKTGKKKNEGQAMNMCDGKQVLVFLIHSHPKNALTIVEYILTCLLVISRSNLQAGRSLVFYWVIAMSFPDFPIHSYLCKAVQWKVMQYN